MPTQPQSTKRSCAGCGRARPEGLEVCASCGLHFASGLRVMQAPEPAAQPPADASRWASPIPEQPAKRTGKKKQPTREERRAKNIADYWRSTWTICVMGTLFGIAAAFGLGVGARGLDPLYVVFTLGAAWVSVFVSCYGLGFAFLGFEEDQRGFAMRLLAVGSLWAAAILLITMVPPATLMVIVGMAMMTVFSLALLLKGLTDREWADSTVMGFGAFVLIFVAELVLSMVSAAAAQS